MFSDEPAAGDRLERLGLLGDQGGQGETGPDGDQQAEPSVCWATAAQTIHGSGQPAPTGVSNGGEPVRLGGPGRPRPGSHVAARSCRAAPAVTVAAPTWSPSPEVGRNQWKVIAKSPLCR